MPSLPPAVADGQIILSSWGNAVRAVMLSGLGRITRRGQIVVGAAPLETMVLDPPALADSPGLLHMTADGTASYYPLADVKPGPDSITGLELAPGSVGPVELQSNAVTRPALANAAVGNAEVADGVITDPKLSAGVREDIANVEDYARPTVPAALIPITRVDTRSIYLAGEGGLPTASGTADGDILIRINAQRAGTGLVQMFPGDWTYDPPDLVDAVGIGGAVYGVAGVGNIYSLTATASVTLLSSLFAFIGITSLNSTTLLVSRRINPGGVLGVLIHSYSLSGVFISALGSLATEWTGDTIAYGIAHHDGHLYVLCTYAVANNVDAPLALRAWNATTLARAASRDIEVDPGASSGKRFVTVADGHFYVYSEGYGGVRVWTAAGGRAAYRDFAAVGGRALAVFAGRLVLIRDSDATAWNFDGSRHSSEHSYVDRIVAALYQSNGSSWSEVSTVRGIHGGGGPSTGITAAQAEAIAALAARAIFTDALQVKLQGIEVAATRDQAGTEIIAAITAEIGTAWREVGISVATLAAAIATHDTGPLGVVHDALVAGHNTDPDAHPGVVGPRGGAVYTGPLVYDVGTNRLSLSHVTQPGVLQHLDIFYGLIPSAVGGVATTDGLTMTGDGFTFALTDVDGVPIAPRQLQKSRLFVFVLGSHEWRLVEPLPFPSPVADYPRYGVFSGRSETVPTAAQFLGGAVWMAQQSYGDPIVRTDNEIHWVADRRDDLAIIAFGSQVQLPNTINNSRRFRLDPVPLLIAGVQYWAYRSRFVAGTGFLSNDYQVVLRPA